MTRLLLAMNIEELLLIRYAKQDLPRKKSISCDYCVANK